MHITVWTSIGKLSLNLNGFRLECLNLNYIYTAVNILLIKYIAHLTNTYTVCKLNTRYSLIYLVHRVGGVLSAICRHNTVQGKSCYDKTNIFIICICCFTIIVIKSHETRLIRDVVKLFVVSLFIIDCSACTG